LLGAIDKVARVCRLSVVNGNVIEHTVYFNSLVPICHV